MSLFIHHHIIVTGMEEKIEIAHQKAVEIFGELVTPIMNHYMNLDQSFYITSDGGSYGKTVSKEYDKKRKDYCEYLNSIVLINYIEIWEDMDNRYVTISSTNVYNPDNPYDENNPDSDTNIINKKRGRKKCR